MQLILLYFQNLPLGGGLKIKNTCFLNMAEKYLLKSSTFKNVTGCSDFSKVFRIMGNSVRKVLGRLAHLVSHFTDNTRMINDASSNPLVPPITLM